LASKLQAIYSSHLYVVVQTKVCEECACHFQSCWTNKTLIIGRQRQNMLFLYLQYLPRWLVIQLQFLNRKHYLKFSLTRLNKRNLIYIRRPYKFLIRKTTKYIVMLATNDLRIYTLGSINSIWKHRTLFVGKHITIYVSWEQNFNINENSKYKNLLITPNTILCNKPGSLYKYENWWLSTVNSRKIRPSSYIANRQRALFVKSGILAGCSYCLQK
jgi:hypothetical protein